MFTVHIDKEKHIFKLQKYHGQDYDPKYWALTVVMIEDTVEVWLVPLEWELGRDYGKLNIEELFKYFELTETPWRSTHTVYRREYCNYTNAKYKKIQN